MVRAIIFLHLASCCWVSSTFTVFLNRGNGDVSAFYANVSLQIVKMVEELVEFEEHKNSVEKKVR